MGVPTSECLVVGDLLGKKLIINEFVAYSELGTMLSQPGNPLSGRSVVILTYALCGFANLSSIGIQIGGIGGIAPERKSDLARLGLIAVLGGTLACFQTATIAGVLIDQSESQLVSPAATSTPVPAPSLTPGATQTPAPTESPGAGTETLQPESSASPAPSADSIESSPDL